MVLVEIRAPSCTFGHLEEGEREVGKTCVNLFVHITHCSLPAVRCTSIATPVTVYVFLLLISSYT